MALLKKRVEVPVHQLRLGQYVYGLDRDWSETPFLFQGFEIETQEELTQLRQLCNTVVIEVTSEEADKILTLQRAAPVRAVIKAPTEVLRRPDPLRLLAIDAKALVESVPLRDDASVRSEIGHAREAMDGAREVVLDIFSQLKNGGGLDTKAVISAVDSMVSSVFRNRDAMGWLARMRSKDDYLYSHSLSTSVWAVTFGRHLGLDKDTLKLLGTGAMLLDVGKTRMPDHLLRKPESLNATEWKLLRLHARYGAQMLRRSDEELDPRIIEMVEFHHERMDGMGYSSGLTGDQIPFLARIAGIVDSYDAMITQRAYAGAKTAYQAVTELTSLAGTAFQPELVELFVQAVGVFPTGTLVELNTGEVGVVVTQNRYRRLKPEIMLILDADKQVREEFSIVDLFSCEENSDMSNPKLWITDALEQGAYGIDPAEYFL
ncbi:MAG: HD-GYP domain-containing protein [Proteobacteria bacterium]|nr:HD-GYP domain-containing protein [Pseudomonadota bacterium]